MLLWHSDLLKVAASGRVTNICFEVLCPHPSTMSSNSVSTGHLQLWSDKVLYSLPWEPIGQKPKEGVVVEHFCCGTYSLD